MAQVQHHVLSGASINYVIPNLKLPADAVGTYTVQVNVDPADLATGQVIQEMDGINNNHSAHYLHSRTRNPKSRSQCE